jgi:alpha-mannosidase
MKAGHRAAEPARAAAGQARRAKPATNLRKQPTLFLVGYAHLDTQWRWEYPQVISEYLPKTMLDNFALFQKYPSYIFNFTGANRYRMMKEYYPADYARMKKYIEEGQWFPAGSSWEENDVNSPSAESLIRQVLYGNEYFRHEFGVASTEFMLPDCFGFPASLPSVLAHAGIKGFSTQKLTWGSAAAVGGPGSVEETPRGIPFNVGVWVGPDGRSVIAALNPGAYDSRVTTDLSKNPKWVQRVELDGKASGVFADYRYYGTGDIGGAPDEASVRLVNEIETKSMGVLPPPRQRGERQPEAAPSGPEVRMGTGPLRVVSSRADDLFNEITPSERKGLPRYQGDLLLTNHSAGSLTSEAVHKRWNRKNELLAKAAEEASVAAMWLGGRRYPLARLNRAWGLVLGGQFHDIMAGTATPQSYDYSWNDDVLAMNQFAGVLGSASAAVASAMNTEGRGTPVVVYNPLSIARQDVVTAEVAFAGEMPAAVRVYGPDGKEVPAQLESGEGGKAKVLFVASVPSVGYAVYDVRAAQTAAPAATGLKVTANTLENARYRVQIDAQGDVASIYDKKLGRELLAGPARLAFQHEKPSEWPAWNMDWDDQKLPPRAYVDGPAKIGIAERGPVRVAIRVEREAQGSHFVQTIRLSAGDAGNRVEFANAIDWHTSESALKAVFPLTASNPLATYNWDAGTIERGNDDPKKFEVPSHRWFDLTDKSGDYGVTILSDCKTGSDKPDDNMLRLTLLYSPGISQRGRWYSDQATQDWGHHEFIYGLAGHAGDWRAGQTDWQAYRLNQPLIAFASAKHAGALGRRFSLVRVSNSRVRVMAVKKAEENNEVIVRLVEISGKSEPGVRIAFAAPVVAAREVNGQEMPVGPAKVERGAVVANFGKYELHTFAVKLGAPRARVAPPRYETVALRYDRAVASDDGTKSNPGFDTAGESLPAEMLPANIPYAGIDFHLAASATGKADAVVAHGQTIALPAGRFDRVYVLAASAAGDQKATFRVSNKPVELTIEDWSGYVGQWDDRQWEKKQIEIPPPAGSPPGTPPRTRTKLEFTGKITPGYIKRAPVAWFASHRHTADGANEPYSYSYLFAYEVDLPAGARTLTLPDNDKIRVMAVTVANERGEARPAWPLYDTLVRGNDY